MYFSSAKVKAFQSAVWQYYRAHGRAFPWRGTHLPYRIFVSEVMLQQTQADRVVPFYVHFLNKFRNIRSLADASTKEVLEMWQGLGYNRRALYLKRAAEIIVKRHGGVFPKSLADLSALPGIGAYTSRAILAFAYNQPAIFIETNIRTAYIHCFFKGRRSVGDKEILPLVEQTLERGNPREWYQALMDYGAMLKRTVGNASLRSKTHLKQTAFEGSRRQIRGRLLKLALQTTLTSGRLKSFCRDFKLSLPLARKIVSDLVSERFLYRRGSSFIVS